jgi:uncharacterized protein
VIDPFRFARSGEQLEKVISLSPKGRLDGVLAEKCDITLQLNGGRHENKRFVLDGHINGSLIVQCQVCLEKMALPLDIDFRVFPVKSEEQAERLHEDFEPIVINENNNLALEELVTNELILSIPVAFSHIEIEGNDCANMDNFTSGIVQVEKKISPFAMLKSKK